MYIPKNIEGDFVYIETTTPFGMGVSLFIAGFISCLLSVGAYYEESSVGVACCLIFGLFLLTSGAMILNLAYKHAINKPNKV